MRCVCVRVYRTSNGRLFSDLKHGLFFASSAGTINVFTSLITIRIFVHGAAARFTRKSRVFFR